MNYLILIDKIFHEYYLLLLAVALRWTIIEYKHTEFIRQGLGFLFNWNKYLKYAYQVLLECPFCNGVWGGYAVYLSLDFDWLRCSYSGLFEFYTFSLTAGVLSLLFQLHFNALIKRG